MQTKLFCKKKKITLAALLENKWRKQEWMWVDHFVGYRNGPGESLIWDSGHGNKHKWIDE